MIASSVMETMVKKQPVEPVIPVIEEDTLPPEWALKTIGEICERVEKVDPKTTPDAEIQYIDIGGIDNRLLRIVDTKTYLGKDAPSRARQLVKANDVVISTVRTYLKNIALVPDKLDGQVASTGFCVLRSGDPWMGKYLYYFVQSEAVLKEIGKQQRGTSYPAVRDSDIKAQFVPVPPKKDRKRIVEAIELQLGRLDAAVARLHAAKAKLKRYKQAVLKAAVEGALTEEWREKNPKLCSSERLMDKVISEHKEIWEKEELAKFAAKGKKPKDTKWKEKYAPPVPADLESLTDLPGGWNWIRIGTIGFVTKLAGFEYTDYVKYDPTGDLAVIKAENASHDGFRRTDFSKVKSEKVAHLTRSKLIPGDILIVFVGSIGNVARVPDDQPYFLGPNIGMIRVQPKLVLPAYLEYFLRSPIGNFLINSFAKAVTQASLSMGSIRLIPFALPPIEEQQLIVNALEFRVSEIETMESTLDAQLAHSTRLRQSVLKRAFEGRLV